MGVSTLLSLKRFWKYNNIEVGCKINFTSFLFVKIVLI